MQRQLILLFAMYLVCLMSLLSCQSDQFDRELVLPHTQMETTAAPNGISTEARHSQCESLGRIAFADCGILIKVGQEFTLEPIADSEFFEDVIDGELIRLTYYAADGHFTDCDDVIPARITCMSKINEPAIDELIHSTL